MDLPSDTQGFYRHQDASDLLLMIAASLVLHIAVFSLLLFVPEPVSTVKINDQVYQVNLVSAPVHHRAAQHKVSEKGIRRHRVVIKRPPVHRPVIGKKRSRPLVIAKKVLKLRKPACRKPKISSSGLIDKAIRQLKKRVQTETEDHVQDAISRLVSRVRKGRQIGNVDDSRQYGGNSISVDIYRMEVEARIKGNWVYPVALINPKDRQRLEAVCVLQVKRDGSIAGFSFKKRSFNVMFDESVKKAIEKSNPLPRFPEGYHKTYDEIEITFNLKDMDI
jgi:colicin import membrane protein